MKNNKLILSNSSLRKLNKFPTYKFSKESNKWIEIVKENEIFKKKTISFITYNIWFEQVNWKNRLSSLFDIFNKYSPDFICLQEVTQSFLNELYTQNFIKEDYYISGNFLKGYDVLILSKFYTNFYNMKFTSDMGRNLLITEIPISQLNIQGENQEVINGSMLIATAHFESLNSSEFRKKQLAESFDLLNNSPLSFLMGDFNFDSSWKNEECNINENFKDSWFVFKERNNLEDKDGHTMPDNDYYPSWRPDRILFKNENLLKLKTFEILGKEPIIQDQFENYVKTPSDHYGLYGEFEIK